MRLYTFCNYYLSSIQQGIQSAHCLAEMFVRYADLSPANDMLFNWARNHKTIVILNGGNNEELRNTFATLQRLCQVLDYYPLAIFNEDASSLNSAVTCVGVIVPEKIYMYNEYERELRKPSVGPLADVYQLNPITLNTFEKELANIIASAPLAR